MDIVVRALPELQSMIITWVAVLLLFFILWKLLYDPVSNFMEARKERIRAEMNDAKSLKEEAIRLRDDYDSRISLAKKESQEIIEAGRKRGEELKESIIAEAKEEANRIVEMARKDIERERNVALDEVKDQAGELAIMIASKIMEQNITVENQKNLVNKFIDEVGRS